MVLADLGRKITTALHSLSKATIINEEVSAKPDPFVLILKFPNFHSRFRFSMRCLRKSAQRC